MLLDKTRILELLNEARADLQRYNDLRANTQQIITAYEQRLELLGEKIAGKAMPLPGVETAVSKKNNNGTSTRAIVQQVLDEANEPLKVRDIWTTASQRGAITSSNDPYRVTDAMLRALVGQGRARHVGPGLYVSTKGKGSD